MECTKIVKSDRIRQNPKRKSAFFTMQTDIVESAKPNKMRQNLMKTGKTNQNAVNPVKYVKVRLNQRKSCKSDRHCKICSNLAKKESGNMRQHQIKQILVKFNRNHIKYSLYMKFINLENIALGVVANTY